MPSDATDNSIKGPCWMHLPFTIRNLLDKFTQPVVKSVGIHICQICTQRLNFGQNSIIFKGAISIKYRNFNFSIYLTLVKNFNRPFGIVGSLLRNAPFQQLWFFPSFWRTKMAYGICCIFTTTWLTTNNNKIPTFWLFIKYIISWKIKALKQYP